MHPSAASPLDCPAQAPPLGRDRGEAEPPPGRRGGPALPLPAQCHRRRQLWRVPRRVPFLKTSVRVRRLVASHSSRSRPMFLTWANVSHLGQWTVRRILPFASQPAAGRVAFYAGLLGGLQLQIIWRSLGNQGGCVVFSPPVPSVPSRSGVPS